MNQHHTNQRRLRRTNRVRAKITGTKERPRLAVYRSNTAISAQVINDATGTTLVSATSRELKSKAGKPLVVAEAVGVLIAEKAKAAQITAVRFDRRRYHYHGRVKALAEGARKGGLQL